MRTLIQEALEVLRLNEAMNSHTNVATPILEKAGWSYVNRFEESASQFVKRRNLALKVKLENALK